MIEKKTQAGTLSAAASGVVLWVLATYVFKGGMPQGVESLVYLAVPGVLAGAAGYLAPHTHRPDLAAGSAPVINVTVPSGVDPKDVADAIRAHFKTAPPSNVTVKP